MMINDWPVKRGRHLFRLPLFPGAVMVLCVSNRYLGFTQMPAFPHPSSGQAYRKMPAIVYHKYRSRVFCTCHVGPETVSF